MFLTGSGIMTKISMTEITPHLNPLPKGERIEVRG
jgi:hypothetical protein